MLPTQVREVLARILIAILALLLLWLLRALIKRLLLAPFRRIANRTKSNFDDQLLDLMDLPSRILVLALGVFIAGGILGVDRAGAEFVTNLARTLLIIAVLVFCYKLVGIFEPSQRQLLRAAGLRLDEKLLPFLRTALRLIVVAIGVVIILQEWNYDVNGLIAGLGLGGLAVSLAAKDTVENLFGFTAIVGDSPFLVGDYIKSPDVEGTVEHVGLRSTRIRQLNQALVTVPNSKLASAAVLNWSRLSKRWYDTTIGIGYTANSDDIRLLVTRIRDMLDTRPLVEKDSILVHFVEFSDHALQILVRCYINLPNWGEYTAEKEQIHLAVMDIIHELGLAIAFPTQSLYIEQMPFPSMAEPRPNSAESNPPTASVPPVNSTYAQGGDSEGKSG